jgi:hypothetical protein
MLFEKDPRREASGGMYGSWYSTVLGGVGLILLIVGLAFSWAAPVFALPIALLIAAAASVAIAARPREDHPGDAEGPSEPAGEGDPRPREEPVPPEAHAPDEQSAGGAGGPAQRP